MESGWKDKRTIHRVYHISRKRERTNDDDTFLLTEEGIKLKKGRKN
jgi:hypothetical protein